MAREKGDTLVLGQLNNAKTTQLSPEQRRRIGEFLLGIQQEIQLAKELGVKMASGFDASSARLRGPEAWI